MSGSRRSDRVAFWRKLIARHESSRLSVGAVCRQAGVSTASFYAWRRRLQASGFNGSGRFAPAIASSSLVPVRVVEDEPGDMAALRGSDFHKVSGNAIEVTLDPADRPGCPPAIRVAIPAGCDEASIRRVLRTVIRVRNEECLAVAESRSSQGGASC